MFLKVVRMPVLNKWRRYASLARHIPLNIYRYIKPNRQSNTRLIMQVNRGLHVCGDIKYVVVALLHFNKSGKLRGNSR